MIENYFKASLNFNRLKGTYLGKIHFNIIIIGEMKLIRGHTTSVQCIPFTIEWGNLCQTSQDARKIGGTTGLSAKRHPNGVSLAGR